MTSDFQHLITGDTLVKMDDSPVYLSPILMAMLPD